MVSWQTGRWWFTWSRLGRGERGGWLFSSNRLTSFDSSFVVDVLEGVNGVNRLATNGEKYNWLPTWSDIVATFIVFFISLFLSKVCMKVNHFKSLFRYLQNFLSSTYLCKIVIKSRRFDFRLFPGLYRALPISCQQLKLIWDHSKGAPLFLFSDFRIFGENPGKCALISREQNSVTKNNLTKIRLISKIRLGVSSSTTYFSW